MKLQIVLLAMAILVSCSCGMKPKHGKKSGQSSTDSKSKEDVQNVLDEDAANDLASLAKNTAGKSKGTKVPPGMYGMRKRVNGHGNHNSSPKPTPPPSTTSTPSTTPRPTPSTTPTPKSSTTPTPSTTPMPTEAESEGGSGQVESVVTVDEVRFLVAEIAALIEDMDMPLEGLKSELVDQVSIIDNEKDLSSFLKLTKEQFHLPMTQFGKMIRTAMNLVDRLYEAGYETDGACLNLNKTVRAMVPESGEIPKNFHEKFLNAYLRSVSCVAQDNARFHKDIADLKELNEGSTRDQVMAAISKVMVGSIRLQRKIAEQYSAVRFVRNLLPKAGLLSNIVQYKRLI